MSNTRIWDALGKTDPKETKPFSRAGGFRGTAIKPMWLNKRMTEQFGPCGTGWGFGQPEFTTMPVNNEILVYCTVNLWYVENGERRDVWGVGGDKVLAVFSSGPKADDEAFKKSFTDALGNAMKFIGAAADIHLGMFDDSKYVNETAREFEQERRGSKEAAQEVAERKIAELQQEKPTEIEQQLSDSISEVNKGKMIEIVKAFGELKKHLVAAQQESVYYSILQLHGAQKSNQFKSIEEAKKCYRDMAKAVRELKATEQIVNA